MFLNEFRYTLLHIIMPSFIKLTFGIINISYINKIICRNEKYYIHVMGNNIIPIENDTYVFTNVYKICKIENEIDYSIIKYWIKTM